MKSLNTITNAIALAAVVTITFAAGVNAQTPVPSPELTKGGNLWSITAFDDASPVHTQMATQSICFEFIGVVGTQNRYRWRSTTFPNWNGIASQEGDQVFMHGDYAQNIGHDGIMWTVDTNRTGSGHWTEWRENATFGNTVVFANATLARTGSCPGSTVPLPFILQPYYPDGSPQNDPLGRSVHKQVE